MTQTDMFSYWNDDVPVSHMTNFEKVRQFHEIYKIAINQGTSDALIELRENLIKEEYEEVREAFDELFVEDTEQNRAALLKELTDLLYVVYGTAVSFGFDIDQAFSLVHQSNLSKLGADGKPIYREDGKVLKGPNYKQADVSELV